MVFRQSEGISSCAGSFAYFFVAVFLAFGLMSPQQASAQSTDDESIEIPDESWFDIFFRSSDRIAAAAQLEPLRYTTLADGEREVRVWHGGGIGGFTLFRFTGSQQHMRGELIFSWGARNVLDRPAGQTSHDLSVYNRTGSCGGFRRAAGKGVCRAILGSDLDWTDVYRSAKEAGLWTLPDQSELPDDGRMFLDGWGITVELRDGEHYRTYHYSNPDKREDWPEADSAVAIAEAVRSVYDFVRRPDNLQVYRGVTDAEYRGAFHLCDAEEVWGYRPGLSLDSLANRAGIDLPSAGEAGYEMKVLALPTPEWLAAQWDSDFNRELQVRELKSIRPAHDLICQLPDSEE